MKKFLSTTLRFLLIPTMIWMIVGLSQAVVKLSLKLGYTISLYLAGLGFCFGLVIFSLCPPFIKVYIFGHELTHWIVAKLFRRKTSNFRVGIGQGSVHVERPNVWIVLAPYLIPIYTVFWIVIVNFSSLWFSELVVYSMLYAGIGFTYSYHVVMTVLALAKKQSDLKFFGNTFSLCLIILVNFSILYWGLCYITRNVEYGYLLLKDMYLFQWQLGKLLIYWFT